MDGIVLIDKPQGATSHDIVSRLRNILSLKRVGHYGTLDPLATGLLLLAVGKATKLFPLFSKENKLYSGRIRLGFSTDTYDAFGKPDFEENSAYPDRETLAKAMRAFVGKKEQVPPPYSAKKLDGKPLYKWARAKKMIFLKPSPVVIHSFELKDYSPPFLNFESRCSSGTYIRSLAHDLGQYLACGAHLTNLRRLAVGGYDIAASHSIEDVERLAQDGRTVEFILPLETLLQEFPKVILKESGVRELQKGKAVPIEHIHRVLDPIPALRPGDKDGEDIYRLFSLEGKFLALAKKGQAGMGLIPFLILS
jgi:tRNA pseudouridine55 synthase